MVEALIVIGLLLVGIQCIWGMYRFCLVQHRVQLAARAEAWGRSLDGCDGANFGGALSALSGRPPDREVNDVEGLRKDSDEPPGWLGLGGAPEGAATLDLPGIVFGRTAVRSTQSFACNERGNPTPLSLGSGADAVGNNVMNATSAD